MRHVLALVLVLSALLPAGPWCALAAQPSPTAIMSRIRTTNGRPIDFHAAVFPDTVYVGQQVTYQVAVLLSDEARSRLRRNPEFLPPELRGLLAFELGTPTRVPPRNYGGRSAYEAHVFQRALFAVSSGALRVPAPQLTYSLPQSASYFSREERFVVRAESAQLVVKPLPLEGRPDDFTGAVGVLRASARFDSSAVRVGDPLVLTVRIEGTGNVRLLPRPVLELSWATVVAGSERVQVDTSGALVRGAKEFDFLLTPTREGRTTVPVVRYPYFDPYREAYQVAETAPADVRVASGGLAADLPADDGDQLPLRAWRGRQVQPISELSAATIVAIATLILLVPVPAIVMLVRRTRRRRAADQVMAAAVLPPVPPPDDTSPAGVARRTRRTLMTQLAARLQVSPADVVARRDLEQVLRRRGVTRGTTRDVLAFLDSLAELGFGGRAPSVADGSVPVASSVSSVPFDDLEGRASQFLARVDAEAVRRGRTRLWARRRPRRGTTSLLLGVAAGAGLLAGGGRTAHAQPEPAPSVAAPDVAIACRANDATAGAGTPLDLLVGGATAAYQARRFATASQRFGAAVAACPRDADLLVNWGTAAWAAGDTVNAVIAWQRAARLDPLAADVQSRVALLPAGARTGLASVPMVPVKGLAVVALLAWVSAWAVWFVAWRTPTGSGARRALGALLIAAAGAASAGAWWGHRQLDAAGLAVVRRPETVRAAPGFEAPTLGGVTTGDVVRVVTAAEGWARVSLTDERDGWIPASRLAPLLGASATR